MRHLTGSAGLAVVVVGCLQISACSSSRREAVYPTEHATGEDHGELAAEYELRAGDDHIGEVKVWSHGAYKQDVGGEDKTVISVGLAVDNTSDTPMTFVPESTRVTTLKANKQRLTNLPISNMQGSDTIQPRSQQEIDVTFVLPPGIAPQNVDAFSVFWTVDAAGQRYSELTPFEELDDRPIYGPYRYAYDPFYDPYYYDPWGWNYYRAAPIISQTPGVIVRSPAVSPRHY